MLKIFLIGHSRLPVEDSLCARQLALTAMRTGAIPLLAVNQRE
jgi:hypothetical protein